MKILDSSFEKIQLSYFFGITCTQGKYFENTNVIRKFIPKYFEIKYLV